MTWFRRAALALVCSTMMVAGLLGAAPAQALVNPMVVTFETQMADEVLDLPISGFSEVSIDWGDGSPVESVQAPAPATHAYPNPGIYHVAIFGPVESFGRCHGDAVDWTPERATYPLGLISVDSWGDAGLAALPCAFSYTGLQSLPAELPPTVTSLAGTFMNSSINLPIGHWDTSNVTSMAGMFRLNRAFNQPIGDWDTSKVTDMAGMFALNSAFNQPIGNWATGNVTDMTSMFYRAAAFNQPIGAWDTSKVESMSWMFACEYEAYRWGDCTSSFNQPIGDWDTSSVKTMDRMFAGADAFNQPIGDWDTSNVTDMTAMFSCVGMNGWERQNFGPWCRMPFNQPLGGWDTGNVTSMQLMFAGSWAFNQPIGGWNTANVTTMAEMFTDAEAFNQPIGTWNTSRVTDMSHMFAGAEAFDQPLGDWDTTQVANYWYFIADAPSFSPASYDHLLNGWAAHDQAQGIWLDVTSARFSPAGAAARQTLIERDEWSITDGGPAPAPAPQVTAPHAPTAVVAVPGSGTVAARWEAPQDTGGAPITRYTATANPGARTCTTDGAQQCTITGLTNGTAYSVRVTATNEAGTSVPSTESSPATPRIPVSIRATTSGYGNVLAVNVNPDRGLAGYAFRVQKRSANGIWSLLPTTYTTVGSAETRSIALGAGTFRVHVPATGAYGSAYSTPVELTAPQVTIKTTTNASGSRLIVDVNPDIGPKSWTFRVHRLLPSGSWSSLTTSYTTTGNAEVRSIDLPKGTYRAVVSGGHGFLGRTSAATTLRS